MTTFVKGCELCVDEGGRDAGKLIFRSEKWRVLQIEGADGDAFTGFCRVVWNDHVRELTDLSEDDRMEFMRAVFAVEGALRASLSPHKMNVASLGNLTPHLHWHVIPRFKDDPAFPKPVWAVAVPAVTAEASLATLTDRQGARGNWQDAVRRAVESV